MPRRKRSKKWISTVIILILLVAACVVVYFVWDGYFRDKSSGGSDTGGSTSQTEGEKGKTDEKKDEESSKVESDEDLATKEKAIQFDGGSPNELEYLTGAINYANVSGNIFSIRVSIYQYLEEGTCELVLMQGGETVYQETTEIMGDATTSTCKGFDVPMAQLNNGEVQFTVYFSSGDKVGEVSGGVEI